MPNPPARMKLLDTGAQYIQCCVFEWTLHENALRFFVLLHETTTSHKYKQVHTQTTFSCWIYAVENVIQCYFNRLMYHGPLTPAFYHNLSFDSGEQKTRWCTDHHSICNTWPSHAMCHGFTWVNTSRRNILSYGISRVQTQQVEMRRDLKKWWRKDQIVDISTQNKHQRESEVPVR